MDVSSCFVPLMNVTAERSGQSPCPRTSSSAPRPFWIVITVADGQPPRERAAAASTPVVFVARTARSQSVSSAGSVVDADAPDEVGAAGDPQPRSLALRRARAAGRAP